MNCEIPDVQAGLREGKGTRDLIANMRDHRKVREFQKNFVLLTTPKPLTVWIITKCENSSKYGNTRSSYLPLEKFVCRSRSQTVKTGMEQQTGSKLEKEYINVVHCHPSYLTYMQSTSCEMVGWMKHKLESRLLGEISIISDTQMTPPLWQKVKNN